MIRNEETVLVKTEEVTVKTEEIVVKTELCDSTDPVTSNDEVEEIALTCTNTTKT